MAAHTRTLKNSAAETSNEAHVRLEMGGPILSSQKVVLSVVAGLLNDDSPFNRPDEPLAAQSR